MSYPCSHCVNDKIKDQIKCIECCDSLDAFNLAIAAKIKEAEEIWLKAYSLAIGATVKAANEDWIAKLEARRDMLTDPISFMFLDEIIQERKKEITQ